jgi:hypothetical protein
MASEAARTRGPLKLPRLRLPERLPDLRKPWLTVFEIVWFAALLLAIVGPAAGLYYRFTTPGENSALMLGSRSGLVLSEDDLTRVRFPLGAAAKAAGVRPGDHIVAIDGIPLSKVVPLSPDAAGQATDTDYALFGPIIQSSEPVDLDLTLRSPKGETRELKVRTSEEPIEQAARADGLNPTLLGVVDLLHILTYPFLLVAAWILHRRKRDDLISSVLSLAILLTIGSELPATEFLDYIAHVPIWLHQRLYDLGNICLLAGILLFPFGQLKPRAALPFLLLLPILFFLHGYAYRATFIIFMVAGVLTLLWRLQNTPPGAAKQQIKWALLGFSGYAFFLAIAFLSDTAKLSTGSFGGQLTLEVVAGLSFGLAFLSLQLGLLVALMRYRLYDAETVISRSANIALITLGVTAVFAGAADALKQLVYNYTGNNGSELPVIVAAVLATVLVNPIQERITRWSEQRFQKNLFLLKDDLPECVRDMRETASLTEMLDDILLRIERGVRSIRGAAIVGGRVMRTRDAETADVEEWLRSEQGLNCAERICESSDRTFPIRLPLVPSSDDEGAPLGFILVGPRPDGTVISKDEQKTLINVSEAIARAVRTVMKRETHERRIEGLIDSNERRIADLEERLGVSGPARKGGARSS